MRPRLIRTAAAIAGLDSVLALVAVLHGRLLGWNASAFLLWAAGWLTLALALCVWGP